MEEKWGRENEKMKGRGTWEGEVKWGKVEEVKGKKMGSENI